MRKSVRVTARLVPISLAVLAATSVNGQSHIERFATSPPTADEVFLQPADPLGVSRHYCADIPGFGVLSDGLRGWQTGWPLEAHTCKVAIPKAHYFIVDQLISRSELTGPAGRIKFSRFDLCAEIMVAGAGTVPVREDAWILLTRCSDSPRQQFTLTSDGEVRSRLDPAKCLTIGTESHEAGNRAPGEPWYQRALTMSTCSKVEHSRQEWRLTTPPADPA